MFNCFNTHLYLDRIQLTSQNRNIICLPELVVAIVVVLPSCCEVVLLLLVLLSLLKTAIDFEVALLLLLLLEEEATVALCGVTVRCAPGLLIGVSAGGVLFLGAAVSSMLDVLPMLPVLLLINLTTVEQTKRKVKETFSNVCLMT